MCSKSILDSLFANLVYIRNNIDLSNSTVDFAVVGIFPVSFGLSRPKDLSRWLLQCRNALVRPCKPPTGLKSTNNETVKIGKSNDWIFKV